MQELIAAQIKKAREKISAGEISKDDFTDDLSCHCLFYRQYQLPCSHLWRLHIERNAFGEGDWERWSYMFEEGGFEIYESTIKEYAAKDICKEPNGPSKDMLKLCERLEEIKRGLYELEENTSWDDNDRTRFSASYVNMFFKATEHICHQGVQK